MLAHLTGSTGQSRELMAGHPEGDWLTGRVLVCDDLSFSAEPVDFHLDRVGVTACESVDSVEHSAWREREATTGCL